MIRLAFEDARPGSACSQLDRGSALLFLLSPRAEWAAPRSRLFAVAGLEVPAQAVITRAIGK